MVFQRMKKLSPTVPEEQVYQDEPEGEEGSEEDIEVEEETPVQPVVKPKIQPKPQPKPQPQPTEEPKEETPKISMQEVIDMIEGHLVRAAQLVQALKS